MRILTEIDFAGLPSGPATAGERVFRQSAGAWLAMPIVVVGLTSWGAWALLAGRAPWPLWIPVGLGVLLTPAMLSMVGAAWRGTNWVARVRESSVLVKFRSPWNRHFPKDTAAIVEVPFAEIECAWVRVEEFAEIRSKDQGRSRETSVELLLKCGTAALAGVIEEERTRPGPRRTLLPGVTYSSRSPHCSMSVPEEGVVRAAFRGQFDAVRPGAQAFVEALRGRVRIEGEVRVEHGAWADMAEEDLVDHARRVAARGDTFTAAALIRERRRCSLSEAMAEVRRWAA